MATPSEGLRRDINEKLEKAVQRSQWNRVVDLIHFSDYSDEHCQWAVEETIKHAPETFVDSVIDACFDDGQLDSMLQHLLPRHLWQCVGNVLRGNVSSALRTRAVEEALLHATVHDFVQHVLPTCLTENLKDVVAHFVSQRQWWAVGQALDQITDDAQHQWAVEEALKCAGEQDIAEHILPYCREEEMQQVLTCMVLQGLWEPVNNVEDDVCIVQHIFSQIMSQGLWKAVGRLLQGNISHVHHRWAVKQASRLAADDDFLNYILPHCLDEELKEIIVHLMARSLWRSADRALEGDLCKALCNRLARSHEELKHAMTNMIFCAEWVLVGKVLMYVSATQYWWVIREAIEKASDSILDRHILCHCSEDDLVAVFPLLVINRKWTSAKHVLCCTVCDTLHNWIILRYDGRECDTLFWNFIQKCHVELSLALEMTKAVTEVSPYLSYDHAVFEISYGYDIYENCSHASCILAKRLAWLEPLCESLMISLLHTLCYAMCSDNREYAECTVHTRQCISEIYSHINAFIAENADSSQNKILRCIKNKQKWTQVFTRIADSHKTDPLFLLRFLQGLNLYQVRSKGRSDDAMLLVMFAVFPLFPQLQSVALRKMLAQQRWDVISEACLSHVWEHDQRQLFKAAVEQRQWDVVRQWADHSVHDDQRDWAMKKAFEDKEWEAYLLLADHGLTLPEEMHAHYVVAKYADWDTVLLMVERGGDITEVSYLLENFVTGNLRRKPKERMKIYLKRCEKLIRLRLRFAKNSARSPKKALKRHAWGSVLFNILHEPTEEYFTQVLRRVVDRQKWHILMHLVRLGVNRAERDRLFPSMVHRQQWGVCRKLLEFGVDVQLCLEALPELIERNQWTLVARVMDYKVDDAVRRHVMQAAFQMRAGALFWHCLNTIKHKEQLSMETQNKLFHQAISRDIWQAVKPFVTGKDILGIQNRDMAFLEAIERHLWDVVDHCQVHGADINMEDENGETPLHREARKGEWEAVGEIVFRDGKPNLLDKDGFSILNRLILHTFDTNNVSDTVKCVIKYGGNIHLPARSSEHCYRVHTPLQALIDKRQADVIQFTVIWCPEQSKGVNERGETALHAACDSSRWDVMTDLMIRKVDPRAVTRAGKSALLYAVLNSKCPQRMVAECCRLGFNTIQPALTGPQESLLADIAHTVVDIWEWFDNFDCDALRQSTITSPFTCAVLCDLPVVALMLYESGSCSDRELLLLRTVLPRLVDLTTEEGKTLKEYMETRLGQRRSAKYYSRLKRIVEKYTLVVTKLATTPRTLLSSCRLVISLHLNIRDKKRHTYVDELHLSTMLRNYLKFSDLSDANYSGEYMGLSFVDIEDEELPAEDDSAVDQWNEQREAMFDDLWAQKTDLSID